MNGYYRVWIPPSAGRGDRFGKVLDYENGWTLVAIPDAAGVEAAYNAGGLPDEKEEP